MRHRQLSARRARPLLGPASACEYVSARDAPREFVSIGLTGELPCSQGKGGNVGTGTDRQVQAYMDAVAAFNGGDVEPLMALIDEHCNWPGVGMNKVEIRATIDAARTQGWVRHDVLSAASVGSLMIAIARNTGSDGSTWLAGGVFRFGHDGTMVALHSTEDRVL